ncbi:MAG: DUF2752 domain-containing protein [Eubacteriales bacterium]
MKLLLLLFVLAVFLLFLNSYGIRIPCMFRVLTGFKCPGCGTTRMSLALLKGNIRTAIYYNKVVPFLIPPLAIIFIHKSYQYILTGKYSFSKTENLFFIISILILLIYMILRNI